EARKKAIRNGISADCTCQKKMQATTLARISAISRCHSRFETVRGGAARGGSEAGACASVAVAGVTCVVATSRVSVFGAARFVEETGSSPTEGGALPLPSEAGGGEGVCARAAASACSCG